MGFKVPSTPNHPIILWVNLYREFLGTSAQSLIMLIKKMLWKKKIRSEQKTAWLHVQICGMTLFWNIVHSHWNYLWNSFWKASKVSKKGRKDNQRFRPTSVVGFRRLPLLTLDKVWLHRAEKDCGGQSPTNIETVSREQLVHNFLISVTTISSYEASGLKAEKVICIITLLNVQMCLSTLLSGKIQIGSEIGSESSETDSCIRRMESETRWCRIMLIEKSLRHSAGRLSREKPFHIGPVSPVLLSILWWALAGTGNGADGADQGCLFLHSYYTVFQISRFHSVWILSRVFGGFFNKNTNYGSGQQWIRNSDNKGKSWYLFHLEN